MQASPTHNAFVESYRLKQNLPGQLPASFHQDAVTTLAAMASFVDVLE